MNQHQVGAAEWIQTSKFDSNIWKWNFVMMKNSYLRNFCRKYVFRNWRTCFFYWKKWGMIFLRHVPNFKWKKAFIEKYFVFDSEQLIVRRGKIGTIQQFDRKYYFHICLLRDIYNEIIIYCSALLHNYFW